MMSGIEIDEMVAEHCACAMLAEIRSVLAENLTEEDLRAQLDQILNPEHYVAQVTPVSVVERSALPGAVRLRAPAEEE